MADRGKASQRSSIENKDRDLEFQFNFYLRFRHAHVQWINGDHQERRWKLPGLEILA